MAKTIFTGANAILVGVLIDARKRAGLTQTELATRIGKDQSFVSLVERSQRRALARAMDVDPTELFATLVKRPSSRDWTGASRPHREMKAYKEGQRRRV
jgi:transcriptional regulator with XRE-family HTH domain